MHFGFGEILLASVFLSHSHADKPFARRLAADLRSRGHVVWIDEAEINIGDSLINKIGEGLEAVDFVAAIISKASVLSEWVRRELDIASNREIKERRVVVLPLLIEDVELPVFLKGKAYGDFKSIENYKTSLENLFRSLGAVEGLPILGADDIKHLRKEIILAQATAEKHKKEADRVREIAFRQKSKQLQVKIREANRNFPLHGPINTAYAFDLGPVSVTLDYVLHCIAKSQHRGVPHQIEILITIEDKWLEVNSMLDAYKEMLDAI